MRVACLIAPLFVTPLIHAAPPGETPAVSVTPATDYVTETYRGQTLLADGSAVGMLLLAGATRSGGLAKLSLATYAFGAPIVHAAHANGPSFFLSVGMRISMPLLFGIIAARAEPECQFEDELDCGDDEFISGRVAGGIFLGIVGAMIIDHGFLAKHKVRRPSRILTPAATPTHGGVTLGLTGTF